MLLDSQGVGAAASGQGSGGSTLQSVLEILGALSASLFDSMSVPGESPLGISTPSIRLMAQLDSPSGATNRLFTQPLTSPGAASVFEPLPASVLAYAGAGPVRTQFLSLAFNPYDGSSSGMTMAASMTRLTFSDASGGEIYVAGLSKPIRFAMPAAAAGQGGEDGSSGAVCSFWSADAAAFLTDGCATLPNPSPAHHLVAWRQTSPPPPPPLPPPPLALPLLPIAKKPPPPSVAAFKKSPPPQLATPPLSPLPPLPPLPPPLMQESYANASHCTATPDAAAVAFESTGSNSSAAVEASMSADWSITGPLACNCSVTVLNCSAEHARSQAAAAAVRAAGGDAAAAAAAGIAASRRVWLSPADALTIPAVQCAADDSKSVLRVFYGPSCALWQPSNELGCYWNASVQGFLGDGCARSPSVQCACLHLTDFSGGARPQLAVAALRQMTSLDPKDIFTKLKFLAAIVSSAFGLMHVIAALMYAEASYQPAIHVPIFYTVIRFLLVVLPAFPMRERHRPTTVASSSGVPCPPYSGMARPCWVGEATARAEHRLQVARHLRRMDVDHQAQRRRRRQGCGGGWAADWAPGGDRAGLRRAAGERPSLFAKWLVELPGPLKHRPTLL